MTMVRQYTPQPQPPLLPPHDLPSSRSSLLGCASDYDPSTMSPQQRPRQHAFPLARHNSYPAHRFGMMNVQDAKPPEHMLRRKTPNGVLAAAYDGTSVEDTERPHAAKHHSNPSHVEQQLPQVREWSAALYFGTGSVRAHHYWNHGGLAAPQIHSELNQRPPAHPPPQPYPIYGTPSGAIEPSLQSLGPTALNNQGPNYWHDATFQHGASYNNYHTMPPHLNNTQQTPFVKHQDPNTYNYLGVSSNDFALPYPPPSQHRDLSLDFQSQVFALPLAQRHPGRILPASGQSTPVPDHVPASNLSSEFGPLSLNAESRDRVFAWAHYVYNDLLKYLQSTRKPNSSNRHTSGQHPARPHIYPRPPPPRQIGVTFSTISTSSFSVPSDYQHGPHDPQGTGNPQGTGKPNRGPSYPSHDSGYQQLSSMYSLGAGNPQDNFNRLPYQRLPPQQFGTPNLQGMDPPRPLRRMSGTSVAGFGQSSRHEIPPSMAAASALDALTKHCMEDKWNWIDGMLLGGCLAYALGDYHKAQNWYNRILSLEPDHVEATSNLAATFLALQQKHKAKLCWRQAVKLRPSYFEAVEHLVGLLCADNRGKEAVGLIEEVERSLRYVKKEEHINVKSEPSSSSVSQSPALSEASHRPVFEYDGDNVSVSKDSNELPGSDQLGFGSSGYAIPGSENGRILALVHAKGNMLYALGDNAAAASAFENAVLIGAGYEMQGINGLIKHILSVVRHETGDPSADPILLHPDSALKTAVLCFGPHGELPGLTYVPEGIARKAAISTTSNSLLSLAKIFQDGMATNSPKASAYQTTHGVREILALYYLSLSLQPSPSTSNNVGILLASVQQAPSKHIPVSNTTSKPEIPGLVPGSGIALALAYYNYGLLLDYRHAHLYTNLGSLLKDIGQLDVAIQMYEHAVACDGNFDIALANLANAVKDKGRISDAIVYYKRAVKASPDFAEAVCGLVNALNSVCGWKGRGGIASDGGSRDRWHVDEKGMLLDARLPRASSSGWIKRVVDLVEKQLKDGEDWGLGVMAMDGLFLREIFRLFTVIEGRPQENQEKRKIWLGLLDNWRGQKWEGARVVRLVERATKRLTWHWYQDRRNNKQRLSISYKRPQLPSSLTVPAAPTVLPFHTFTSPMSAKQIRLISQRNGLRISCSTLKAPWLPLNVYAPPPAPQPHLNVGYVSSDFNNHPLAHLMQSVFGLHDRTRVKAFCYATTASDGSIHRQQIERESPVFYDASSWSAERLVNQIVSDKIHILINLNGYTRGARNEVFAARPAPIQMSFMGFAGTLGAEWCDYLLADDTAVPPETLRSSRRNVDVADQMVDENFGGSEDSWIYGENIIFCRDTFFCCDHRQSAPDSQGRQFTWEEEQQRRWSMRKEIFPQLPDDAVILGNFNQLYKIEPTTFRTWLRILQQLPKAVLWLLRFPDLGETHLKQTALMWAGTEVASRVLFTDVAQKHQHIARARVCDLFLDTPECNAHTTAADVLWSGTPLLTLPRYKYKMCSRMAASILKGALPKNDEGKQAAKELIAATEEEYEKKAVSLGRSCIYRDQKATGRLNKLRKMLYEARWTSALFDTTRWVRDLEDAYDIAWKRWEDGEGGDIWLQPQRDF